MSIDDNPPDSSPEPATSKSPSEELKDKSDPKYKNLSISLMLNVRAQNTEVEQVPKINNLLPPLNVLQRNQPPNVSQESKPIPPREKQSSPVGGLYPKLRAEPVNVQQAPPYQGIHGGYQQPPIFHPLQPYMAPSGPGSQPGSRGPMIVGTPGQAPAQAPHGLLGQPEMIPVQIPYPHMGHLQRQTYLALDLDPLQEYNRGRRFRRRYNQIVRKYNCSFPGCTKSYGSLNHLNTHIVTKKHGYRKSKADFQQHNYQEDNPGPMQYYGEPNAQSVYQPPVQYPSEYSSGNYWYHPQQRGQPHPPPAQNGPTYPHGAPPGSVPLPSSNVPAPGYIYYPPGYPQPHPGAVPGTIPGQQPQYQRTWLPPKQRFGPFSSVPPNPQPVYQQSPGVLYGSSSSPPTTSSGSSQPTSVTSNGAPVVSNGVAEPVKEDTSVNPSGPSST